VEGIGKLTAARGDADTGKIGRGRRWLESRFGLRQAHDASGVGLLDLRVLFSSRPGYPGDLPCPAKRAAIESDDDEGQSTLQCGTLDIREERDGEAELHRVAHNRKRREGQIQLSVSRAGGEFPPRFALGISRLVASRPTVAIAMLDSPKTTEPPVSATIDTKMTGRLRAIVVMSAVRSG
jgi:hypothetical protein